MSEKKKERFVHAVPEYSEATDLINRLAETTRRLGLSQRFKVVWEPRKIVERQPHTNIVLRVLWGVYIVDSAPHLPVPLGLTNSPRVTVKSKPKEEQPQKRSYGQEYVAFGKCMNLNQWAKVAGVTRPTLKARLDAGLSLEEAITDIALKKSA